VNQEADEKAAIPGAPDFDQEKRKEAEEKVRSDRHFESLGHLRNDLLHAQYRSESGTREASDVVKQVKREVQKFARRAGAGDRGA
jgi:hypothetical protein